MDEVILEFHRRAFGEEMARVNMSSREERWAYVHRLWARIQQKQRLEAVANEPLRAVAEPEDQP